MELELAIIFILRFNPTQASLPTIERNVNRAYGSFDHAQNKCISIVIAA